jgi:hypothetical protein
MKAGYIARTLILLKSKLRTKAKVMFLDAADLRLQ